jgi:hypothetical protein
MSISRSRSRFARGHVVTATVALLLAACVADPLAPPVAPDQAPGFARATTGPTVTSTLPKSGPKGQTLDVRVYGSGFTAGATATWALRGVADPSKVRTNSTTVVSSTELIANITIASDATIDYWDVQVSAAVCCKTGIGTEMFEVTTATPVGPGTAFGVNDAGDIVGTFDGGGSLNPRAFAVSGADLSFSDIGARKATAISQDGLVAVGGVNSPSGSAYPGVWTRATGASWPTAGAPLPPLPGLTGGLAYAVAALPAEGVTVIAGTMVVPSTPVYWESANGTWTWSARRLPLPAAYASSPQNVPKAVIATGDIAGHVQEQARGNLVPVLWRRVAGSYVVDVLPLPSGWNDGAVNGISPDGSIMVGYVRQSKNGFSPAFWTRDASNNYTVGLLPTLNGTYGYLVQAYGVTVVGGVVRAVGTSPGATNGTWVHGVIWTWTAGGSDIQVRDMGGVGTKTDVTPYAINPAGTIAVGADGTGAIKWLLQP